MITSHIPETWDELQTSVGRILTECGFSVEIEKKISTARSIVEVDVFAEEVIKGRSYTIIAECKHWKSKIPQTIIHGFRTVISDIGANVGYIISLNGFQSGSFDSAGLTNIKLLTWEQFQQQFELSWYENYFSPTITEELDPLLTYTEPLLPAWYPLLLEEDQKVFCDLREKYLCFGYFIMTFTPYMSMGLGKSIPIPSLPLSQRIESGNFLENLPPEILSATGYRELMEICLTIGKEAIAKFRAIKAKVASISSDD